MLTQKEGGKGAQWKIFFVRTVSERNVPLECGGGTKKFHLSAQRMRVIGTFLQRVAYVSSKMLQDTAITIHAEYLGAAVSRMIVPTIPLNDPPSSTPTFCPSRLLEHERLQALASKHACSSGHPKR
jgi:hypothetical protein